MFNFPADSGPVMTGTWFNRRTQDSFTVRDSFLEDNQMIVLTTDGRRLDYNTIQDYEQIEGPVPPKNSQASQLPPEVASMVEDAHVVQGQAQTGLPAAAPVAGMLPEDLALIQGNQAPANDPLHTPMSQLANQTTQTQTPLSEEEEEAKFTSRTIKRTLDRAKKDPDIAVGIKWTKYPEKQMEMLVDYMGIGVEDIVAYYISKIDLNAIRQKLESEIRLFIEKKFVETEDEPKDEKKDEKPKAKSTKTEKPKK